MNTRVHTPILILVLIACQPALGQTLPVGDAFEDYARYLQLRGQIEPFSFGVRPLPVRELYGSLDEAEPHPWRQYTARLQRIAFKRGFTLEPLDPELRALWNSSRPYGQNDAAIWQGKGGTVGLSAGAYVRLGPLSAAFKPQILYNQNTSFDLWPGTDYRYPSPYGSIDLPQRFGADPFTTLDLGQSYIRLGYKGLAVGLSNENMWWGPALHNPIVMSNNAPGFPHLFLGTSGPLGLGFGQIQGRWLFGRLSESDYFDENPDNDDRLFTGIVLDITPRFVPGLSIGVTRVYTLYTPDRMTRDYYLLAFQNPFKKNTTQADGISDDKDQILSGYVRWLLPESGLEVFAEIGRGDHSEDARDLNLEPEHTAAYTIGFQKAFTGFGGKDLRLAGEITRLQDTRTAMLRQAGSFYVHSQILQGYTQRGQVIGAGIGPGSNSQFLGLDWFAPWGKAGIFTLRTAYDANRFYYYQQPIVDSEDELELDLALGAHALLFIGKFEIGASLTFVHLFNQYYERDNDLSNLNATLTIRRTLVGPR